MLKLAALGALGYAAYRYYEKNKAGVAGSENPRLAVAGGPLSDDARIQRTPI